MERRYSKEEEALEIQSLRRIISAYLNYSDASEKDVRRYEGSYKQLSPSHKALLSHLPLKFQRLRRCISMNTFFIMNMLQAFEPPLEMSQDTDIDEPIIVSGSNSLGPDTSSVRGMDSVATNSLNRSNEKEEMHVESSSKSIMDRSTASEYHTDCCAIQDNVMVTTNPAACHCDSNANGTVISPPRDWMDPSLQLHVPLVDVDKVRCIIRNIVRDWALEGEKERDQCYKPILEELSRLFPDRCKERPPPSCLVPGAGLGRLAMDISCLGFVSQGNEFSYYMMICSSFILNQTQIAGEWTVYPWIHSNCNSFSDNDQLRPVSFPDIHPASAGITEGFSMCGGDFVEVYNDVSQEASWDAVVTCFFLDTAPNIVEYIEIIHKILKDGGVWINLGPLLYHFADTYGTNGEMSIELSLEDVKRVALQQGFELEVERIIETTYTTNHRSMMQNRYFAAFWTMKKRSKT